MPRGKGYTSLATADSLKVRAESCLSAPAPAKARQRHRARRAQAELTDRFYEEQLRSDGWCAGHCAAKPSGAAVAT